MAAKPPPQVRVECPPSRHDDGGGGWWHRRAERSRACRIACPVRPWVLVGAAVVTAFVLLFVFLHRAIPEEDPVYTAAFTGVAGLDLAAVVSRSPLSPVFNLTFQIDNTRNGMDTACLPAFSTAAVSYGDAFLAGGSVPPFCARKRRHSERAAARAWGDAVAVPPFLRDQLAAELAAGGAEVDVKVTMPHSCSLSCGGADVLSCKVNVRGGPASPCRLDQNVDSHT